MYLYKFSKQQEKIVYRKTYFTAAGFQLNDLKTDNEGNILSLVAQYQSSGELFYKISRINSGSGNISWNQTIPYSQDSCNLVRLVVSDNDRFYAVGCHQANNYFCKGFALRITKNGHREGNIPAPDSVNYQRLHWLSDGITDHNNRLIAIGGTTDLDTTSFVSSYLKAFVVRYNNDNCNEQERPGTETINPVAKTSVPEKEMIEWTNKLVVFPNPVKEQMTVTGLNRNEYDQLSVYNMQGEKILQQKFDGTTVRVDANILAEGVYLLVLHSSVSLKEKNFKFFVRR